MKKVIAISLLGALLISCSHHKKAKPEKVVQPDMLSDAQVSNILMTANDGEVLLAQHVIGHTKNARVKEFARHMVDDHTLNTMTTHKIAEKEQIQAQESPKSEELVQAEQKEQQKLMSLKGHALDVAYMDNQIETHEKVLSDLNTTLIPETQDSELRAHLQRTAEKVQGHLDMAKEVRATL